MSVELRHLRYFVAVAEELSFSRAAVRLRVAQPALSAQVATLERRLGCRLLTRTTRKVELTDQGRLLLERAREILERVDETLLELEASVRGERGVVRVGFVAHGAGEVGSEILRRFAAALPGVETELVESATLEAIQRNVRDRETDVAFSWLPLLFDELEAEPLGTEGLAVALSPDHALAAAETVTIADLRGTPIVAPWEDVPFELLRPWLGKCDRTAACRVIRTRVVWPSTWGRSRAVLPRTACRTRCRASTRDRTSSSGTWSTRLRLSSCSCAAATGAARRLRRSSRSPARSPQPARPHRRLRTTASRSRPRSVFHFSRVAA